jgi:hypothetical protein
MATQRPALRFDSARLPRAFPVLERSEGGLLWVQTDKASPDELRLHLAYRLWKLRQEIDAVRNFGLFMALARNEEVVVPLWLHRDPGPLPPWADAISTEDYQALDREWNGDIDDAGDEEV